MGYKYYLVFSTGMKASKAVADASCLAITDRLTDVAIQFFSTFKSKTYAMAIN